MSHFGTKYPKTSLIESDWANEVEDAVIGDGTLVSQASYIVYKSGTTYYAKVGAVGGTAVSPSTVYDTVLQAVVNALPNGGVVFHKPATSFELVGEVTVPYSGIRLLGSGMGVNGSVIKCMTNDAQIRFDRAGDILDLEFSDFYVDVNYQHLPDGFLHNVDMTANRTITRSQIRNVKTVNALVDHYFINFRNYDYITLKECSFRNAPLRFYSNGYNSTNLFVENNVFYLGSGATDAILLECITNYAGGYKGFGNHYYGDPTYHDVRTGLFLHVNGGRGIDWTTMIGDRFEGCQAIRTTGDAAKYIEGGVISDCRMFSGEAAQTFINLDQYSRYWNIHDNFMGNDAGNGIIDASVATGTAVNRVHHNNFRTFAGGVALTPSETTTTIANAGYNSRGNIATPWANGAGNLSDAAKALDNPVSHALYTVTNSPKLIILTNCAGISEVQIDGVTLTNITTNDPQIYQLNPVQTIHTVWTVTTPHGEVYAQ